MSLIQMNGMSEV